MNKALVDPHARWGEQFHFTGFWTPPRAGQTLPVPLRHYIESGPAPIVLTTGSMVSFDSGLLVQRFREALGLAGERGVLVAGWSDLRSHAGGDERLLVVDEADYEQLFASAACVIHHGGVGTLAAVLRAGVPSILLPQIGSQQEFGRILQRQRLCVGMFDTANLVPAALAKAIRMAIDDVSSRDAARQWQRVVRADRGTAYAGELIDAHWTHLSKAAMPSVRIEKPA